MTTKPEAPNAIADLGTPHVDSCTATWCVDVWHVGACLWACDTEQGNGTVHLLRRNVRDDNDDGVHLWTGHVTGLADAVANASR